MYKNVIAIDLETTGVDPTADEIMEIGVAVFSDGKIVDTFDEFVAVKSPPPLNIQKLTGITPKMLEGARTIQEVLPDFMDFIDREDPVYIAHNAGFDRAFLRSKSEGIFDHIMTDTIGLARIFFPTYQSHALGFLADKLDLQRDDAHRALSDCETTIALWERLEKEAADLPEAVLDEFLHMLEANRTHPYRDFFTRLKRNNFARQFGKGKGSLPALFSSNREILENKPPERDIEEDHGVIDIKKIKEVFDEGGILSQTLENYEAREGQEEMAVRIGECFNKDSHFMVEAPTGIGKSLAYLIPSVLFSLQEDYPVVLSTNTRNLQSQLFEKDIPLVKKALGVEFNSAIIKGRGNYLCLRKLMYILDAVDRELDRDERMQMLTLLVWAVNSRTGDVSECVLTGRPNFPPLWAKLRTVGDECMGRSCKHYNKCFLRRARALSLQADIVVANHALVFSEMNMESAVLPDYHHIVFDEAHNLEAAATDHLSVEITFSRINQVLTRLYRPHRRKKGGTGLAASIKAQLASESGKGPKELMEKCDSNCDAIIQAVDDALHFVMPFFETLGTLLPTSDRHGQIRYTEGKKIEKVWQPADAAKVALVSSLAKVMRASESAVENMREMPSGSITYLRDFQRELEAVVVWIKEVVGDIEFVLAGTESNYVYWIEKVHPRQGGSAAKAAPLSIAEIMNDQVYARKRSCIFSSATLTIRNNFKFLSGRLGINKINPERLETFQAPSPFDYDEQCVVAVPTFLAEPNQGQGDKYIEGLSSMLAEVYRATEGRGMALFTSYRMLQGCHKQLQQSMKGDGITILAQGQSGSREHITTLFKNDIHSVLLGTHSFWEGVDVVGESLSCLTIARLPFGVFTDPIIAARCEKLEAEGKDPFLHYSLPSAVIRFKQGFGRLIRSRQDKGLIIVADRRVVAKRYGSIFLQSIPTHTESFNDRSEFLDMVEHFFRNNINKI